MNTNLFHRLNREREEKYLWFILKQKQTKPLCDKGTGEAHNTEGHSYSPTSRFTNTNYNDCFFVVLWSGDVKISKQFAYRPFQQQEQQELCSPSNKSRVILGHKQLI